MAASVGGQRLWLVCASYATAWRTSYHPVPIPPASSWLSLMQFLLCSVVCRHHVLGVSSARLHTTHVSGHPGCTMDQACTLMPYLLRQRTGERYWHIVGLWPLLMASARCMR
jgi:hypothetical protein